MRSPQSSLRKRLGTEVPALWRLAWPVVLGEVGWQAMGIVDTVMVGRVGAEALAGVGVGNALFFVVAIFGIGMLLGLDFAIARAVGAGERAEVATFFWHGIALAVVLGVVLTLLLLAATPMIARLGLDEGVAVVAAAYLDVVVWSTLPLLLYTALRRFLQAVGAVRVIAITILVANVVNAIADWTLVLGNWGAPALGATGAAWATFLSRALMLAILAGYVLVQHADVIAMPVRFGWQKMSLLARLGLPAALQLTLEVGVFAVVTALVGRFGAAALAAHHVVLNIASLSFMVPLGISAAAAVRVGHSFGRRDAVETAAAGWTAIAAAAAVMCGFGVLFIGVPELLMRAFTPEPEVIAVGASLLVVAAAFQLFDGIQVVATGALRGTGETRTAMFTNLVAHWFLGLPVGVALGFGLAWGATGLWLGLCCGLVVAAVALLVFWQRRQRWVAAELDSAQLREAPPA